MHESTSGHYSKPRRTRAETSEIRDLLEANLAALNGMRALLYVALRELIVANENEQTRA